MKVLITGSVGFIGYHTSLRFIKEGWEVLGLDSMSTYYDVQLKTKRNANLLKHNKFSFNKINLDNFCQLEEIISSFNPDIVVHLAAQAGVRFSLESPKDYFDANLAGTFNLLEALKNVTVKHLIIASSSSVYGRNKNIPYKETEMADHPVSFYAATKKAKETLSHSYAHLYKIPTTCLRFFTVYGPGRPEMALFKLTDIIMKGEVIKVYNQGEIMRDFKYIDDLVNALFLIVPKYPTEDKQIQEQVDLAKSPQAPWQLVNIGNSQPVKLIDFIKILENCLNRKAKKIFTELHSGDVIGTYADTSKLKTLTGYTPKTDIREGIVHFLEWYREYFNLDFDISKNG